ncbi:MAG: glycine cleavage system protein GcvH [Acidimicrobiia bacterium]|nr:glycine cleavage system protein GcvH [Acidimicrobiia bacterium]
MHAPDDRRYTEEHEWVLLVGENRVRIGISDFAQDQLGDVVYVELPDVGATVVKGGSVAEIESTKSVGDVYAPISGEIVAVNSPLADTPELVNSDPYGDGWVAEIEGDTSGVDDLLDAAGYQSLTE